MKRRIAGAAHTGLGGNGKVYLNSQPTKDKKLNRKMREYSKAVYETFFKGTKLDEEYVDADYSTGLAKAGIEPTYQFEPLKVICVNVPNKKLSYIETGRAVGPWASAVLETRKYYKDYKYASKFVRFVDAWHQELCSVTIK